MRARIVSGTIRADIRRVSRDADDVLHAGLQGRDVEGRLFGELVRVEMGCDECPDDRVFSEPVGADFDPVLLEDLYAGDFGELLRGWASDGAREGEDLVVGEGVACG